MKENVFFLINSLHGGGAERVVSNLTRGFEKKYDVYVILLYEQTGEDYPAGGNIIVLNDGKPRNRISMFLFFKRELEKLACRYKPRYIISFLLNACFCNMIAKTGAKKIISIRNYVKKQFTGTKLFLWELCFRRVFYKADTIVSVTNLMKQNMIESYGFKPEKSVAIYNPYNIEEIREAAAEPIEEELAPLFTGRVIVTLGSIHRQKGHCHLIRSFAELKKGAGDIKLVIIGKPKSPGLEDKLKQLAVDLHVDDDVVLLGHRQNPHKYLSRSSIFAFPSLYEGFPNALVEAMICGLPVIASDCKTGPREILAPDTEYRRINTVEECEYGILVPAAEDDWLDACEPLTGDELLLKQAMEAMLADAEKRERYRQKSIERGNMFAMDRIIENWMEIL